MRCYLVKAEGCERYASTNADAREKREEIMKDRGVKKKDVTIEQTDIATDKGSLLEFINELCAKGDVKVERVGD